MPHIVIEYAQNLDATLDLNALVTAVHEGAERSDLFQLQDIKIRATAFHHYRVGGEVTDFIHLRAHILSGRSEAQKKHLSRCLLESIENMAATVASQSVEVIDMDRFSYAKRQL